MPAKTVIDGGRLKQAAAAVNRLNQMGVWITQVCLGELTEIWVRNTPTLRRKLSAQLYERGRTASQRMMGATLGGCELRWLEPITYDPTLKERKRHD